MAIRSLPLFDAAYAAAATLRCFAAADVADYAMLAIRHRPYARYAAATLLIVSLRYCCRVVAAISLSSDARCFRYMALLCCCRLICYYAVLRCQRYFAPAAATIATPIRRRLRHATRRHFCRRFADA